MKYATTVSAILFLVFVAIVLYKEFSNVNIINIDQKKDRQYIENNRISDSSLVADDDLKWRLLEKNFADTLRLMRNTIFAKHGYVFESDDLRKYYNSKEWYRPNPNYDNSQLSINDNLNIDKIKKHEDIINQLSKEDSSYLIKLYSFRESLIQNGFDTTITQLGDVTNNGIKDSLRTKITFTGESLRILISIKSTKEELWSYEFDISTASPFFYINEFTDIFPTFSYYQFIINDGINLVTPRMKHINGREYFSEIGHDTLVYSSLLSYCENTSPEFKKYLSNYSGYELVIPYNGVYDVEIWYPPAKSLVKLWSGP